MRIFAEQQVDRPEPIQASTGWHSRIGWDQGRAPAFKGGVNWQAVFNAHQYRQSIYAVPSKLHGWLSRRNAFQAAGKR